MTESEINNPPTPETAQAPATTSDLGATPPADPTADLIRTGVNEQETTADPTKKASVATQDATKKLENDVLRLRAELENQAKRLRAENDRAVQRGVAQVISDLLDVADNLERALDEKQAGDLPSMQQGVRMTLSLLQGIMSSNGINVIEPNEGDKLNPKLHDALFQEEKEGLQPGQIIRTVVKGYSQDDRIILRAAKVVVATVATQPDAAPQPSPQQPSGNEPTLKLD